MMNSRLSVNKTVQFGILYTQCRELSLPTEAELITGIEREKRLIEGVE